VTFNVGARDDERQRQLRHAMRSGLPELERSRLRFGKRVVEDERTGPFYSVCRGVVEEAEFSPAAAFYVSAQGDPVYLEPAPGPKNRDELTARREAKEQARAERLRPRCDGEPHREYQVRAAPHAREPQRPAVEPPRPDAL